jgi:8-oxo-dGTP diphosphatase
MSGRPVVTGATNTARACAPVDLLLMLADADRVLLALRAGTGYADGQWNLPSGKLEIGEDAVSALVREVAEEIGIRLARDEPRLGRYRHQRNTAGLGRVGLVSPSRTTRPATASRSTSNPTSAPRSEGSPAGEHLPVHGRVRGGRARWSAARAQRVAVDGGRDETVSARAAQGGMVDASNDRLGLITSAAPARPNAHNSLPPNTTRNRCCHVSGPSLRFDGCRSGEAGRAWRLSTT